MGGKGSNWGQLRILLGTVAQSRKILRNEKQGLPLRQQDRKRRILSHEWARIDTNIRIDIHQGGYRWGEEFYPQISQMAQIYLTG